jgi:hypothetical protein
MRNDKPRALACAAKSSCRRAKSGGERHRRALGHQHARVESREVDQLAELQFERIGCGLDVRDERTQLGVARAR